MRFGVLGLLQIQDDAGAVRSVVGTRQRVLLAALLVHVNQVVPAEQLAEIVWEGAPPTGAAALRTQVMRLRRALGPEAGARIVTREPGYAITLGDQELDATLFESWCQSAGSAVRVQRWDEASQAAEQALLLWRGAPLADVPSQVLREAAVPRLEQLRVQVLEERAEAQLCLGHYDRLVPQLRELTAAHPLRERFHAQLMLALYRSGRQAEALAAYQDARRLLVEELGVEPGPQLRELQGRILAGEEVQPPAKPSAAQAPARAAAVGAVPRQLPAAPGHFTGRRDELEMLVSLVPPENAGASAGGTVVISAIDGMAGIGKTALAVHAAHRLADWFPDGQLFMDLHGYTKGSAPREAGEALVALLRGLGVDARQLPEDLEERAAFYRQCLAGTRTLVVLDNALDEAQVRPLLPGHPGCLVLVTSRRRLKGLDDARNLSLDLLAPQDAVTLLLAVAGPDRIPADDPLLGDIADLCGRLPLALRIAGALLRHRPAWSSGHLAGLLRDRHRRVHALSDGERDLATVFDLSYTGLTDTHQNMFRRLGQMPGPDTDAYAAAALLNTDPGTATAVLEDLVDHNLLIEQAPGRYRLHDLIRIHARTLADQGPEADRNAALDRLLHYYAHTAYNASIPIARYPRPAPDGPAPVHAPDLPDPETARTWLRTERENLEAAHSQARALSLDGHALALAAGMAGILLSDGPFKQALDLHQAAADVAERQGQPAAWATALADMASVQRQTGDLPGAVEALSLALRIYRAIPNPHGEATALTDLGLARHLIGDHPGAADALTLALEIFHATGNHRGEAGGLINLGRVRRLTGDLRGAVEALSLALRIYRAIPSRHGEATALSELGLVRQQTGDLPGAIADLTGAEETFRAIGHRHGAAIALAGLGMVRRLSGDLSGATADLTRALETFRAIGHSDGEACALVDMGLVRQHTGDLAGAAADLARALEIFRSTGHHHGEAEVLNYQASIAVAANDLPQARVLYRQALAMNRELRKPDHQAVALEGLGECHLSEGDAGPAIAELRQALEIYEHLGMAPGVERVRTRLASLAAS